MYTCKEHPSSDYLMEFEEQFSRMAMSASGTPNLQCPGTERWQKPNLGNPGHTIRELIMESYQCIAKLVLY